MRQPPPALRTPEQIAAALEACLAVAAELGGRAQHPPPGRDVGTWLALRWLRASRKVLSNGKAHRSR